LGAALHKAVGQQEFCLHYQPIVNLKFNNILGVEALIRWRHPECGFVSLAEFIPIAESCGLILPIGRFVLREACAQAKKWQKAGLPELRICVNISAAEFRHKDFLSNLCHTLTETDLESRYLEIKITERILMQHVNATELVLADLSAMGLHLAVDDFGTGYSSLSYLSRFPITSLKIDRSFVQRIMSRGHEEPIISAVISMGRSLKQRVVAEGIETEEQLAFLQRQNCEEGQGYYFSRPVDAEHFVKLFETGVCTTSARWKSRGILPRVDQKQARAATISRARLGKGADGDAVGLPHLQLAAFSLQRAPQCFQQNTASFSRVFQSQSFLINTFQPLFCKTGGEGYTQNTLRPKR
jgi:diguanylate cyclase